MNELDKKIIELFKVIYDLNDTDASEIINTIKDLTDEEKKSTIVALYERYKSKIKNSEQLLQGLNIINNKLEETIEKEGEQKINFNF